MTSDDVLGRIMNHEINIQEANNMKNIYKGISTSKILLSKQTRARRRMFRLRALVRKKKKRRRR
jgi:hypothetical protein